MLFKIRPPYNHKYLNTAEKYCSYAYMVVLTIVLLKVTTDSNVFDNFCSVAILITLIGADGYILVNVFWLYIIKVHEVIKKLKEKLRDKEILKKTLELLKIHHSSNNQAGRSQDIIASKRRFGMSLNLSKRYKYYLYNSQFKLTNMYF